MKTNMSISIAIPTYEANGNGWLFLSEALNSIAKQTYKNVEVVISDQSTDDNIKKLCVLYSNFLNVKYIDAKNTKRSNSPNANNAIKECTHEIIKILFQDDFFILDTALEQIVNSFNNPSVNWSVTGCKHCQNIHYMESPFIPTYNQHIYLGKNTISSPSVLAFRNKHYFDENLVMLMDCDLYKKLYDTYGLPHIINDYLICNRMHANQLQNKEKHLLAQEIEYCKQKFERQL